MDDHSGHDLLRVVDLDLALLTDDLAGVADLTSTLCVEGCVQKHDLDIFPLGHFINYLVL